MCRFNLILVNGEKAEELLKREGYRIFIEDLNGYRAFQKGYCNCGSFVGSLLDKKEMKYSDAIAEVKREKLVRLYQIQKVMAQPGYKERREEYSLKKTMLCNELEIFFKRTNDYERRRTKEIQEKYSGQERNNQMSDLHNEIHRMLTNLDDQPDYKKKQDAYMNFIRENQTMDDTLVYYLSKEEYLKECSNSIPLTQLLELPEEQAAPVPYETANLSSTKEGEMQTIPDFTYIEEVKLPSTIIDEAITEAENETFESNLSEYHTYYKLFSDLLECVPALQFTTVWVEPKAAKIVKSIDIDSFVIEDMAFLEFDEILELNAKFMNK